MRSNSGRDAGLAVFGLAAITWYALSALSPTLPRNPEDRALLERLRAHVAELAVEPHPLGSTANRTQRDRLVSYFQELGLETRVQRTSVVYDHPRRGTSSSRVAWVENVIARLPGSGAPGTLAVMSHYDSVAYGPGAGDAGAGVAAVKEAARELKLGPPPRHDVLFVLTDGEEVGLFGAQAFFDQHPLAANVALVLNFEARGSSGPAYMFETSPGNAKLVAAYAAASPRPLANSMSYEVYRRMPNDTDLTIAKAAGKHALNFAFIDDYPDYHAATDTPANLDDGSLYHHGIQASALARHFAALDDWNFDAGDATYFNPLPGVGLIRYGESTALLIGLLTLVAGLAALWRLRRTQRVGFGGLLRALAAAVALVLLVDGAFGSFIAARLDAAPRWHYWAYLSRHHDYLLGFVLLAGGFTVWFLAAAVRGLSWTAIVVLLLIEIGLGLWGERPAYALLLAAIAGALLWPLRKPIAAAEFAAAGWLIWLLLLGGLLWAAPNASFLIAWPLLPLLALALCWPQALERTWPPLLATLPALVLWTPLIYTVYLGIGIGAPQLPLAALALLALLVAPVLLRAGRWARGGAGLGISAAGLVVIATAWINEGFDPRHPRPSELFYVFDAALGERYWASGDSEPSDWILSVLGNDRRPAPLSALLPGAEREMLTAIAPPADLNAAAIELVDQRRNAGTRTLRLRLASPERAEYINLWLPADGRIRAAAVNGRELPVPEELDGPLWRWRLYGLPPDGTEIELELADTDPLPVRITELAYRWPPGVAPPPRPADSMRAPYSWSDATVIHSRHAL